MTKIKRLFTLAGLIAITVISMIVLSTLGNAEQLAKVETSGMFFKDSIEVHIFDDPTISGVTCYVTIPKRGMSFEDPTNSSISCRQVGEISGKLVDKESIFTAKKGLWFKTFRVSRFFDKKRNVLVYLSYTVKATGKNASHSISVVPVK